MDSVELKFYHTGGMDPNTIINIIKKNWIVVLVVVVVLAILLGNKKSNTGNSTSTSMKKVVVNGEVNYTKTVNGEEEEVTEADINRLNTMKEDIKAEVDADVSQALGNIPNTESTQVESFDPKRNVNSWF